MAVSFWLGFVAGAVGFYLWRVFRKPLLTLTRADGRVYMTRWALVWFRWWPWGSIYLHRLSAPDPDPHPHNHPWNAIVLVLWGRGYRQMVDSPRKYAHERVWRFNRLGAEYHRITELLSPTVWTLTITGPRVRSWGFLVDGRHMHWRDYVCTHQAEVLTIAGNMRGVEL